MAKLLFGGLFLLLAATQILGAEYKTEFAQKFEAGIRANTVDFYKVVSKGNIEFLENLLKEVKPDSEHIPKIREYINAFTALKAKVEGQEMDSEQLVQQILDIRKYMDLDALVDSLEGENVSKSSDLLKEDFYEKLKEEYSVKLAQLWFDLYKNVPADELSKYPEYKSINDYLELMSDPDNHKYTMANEALERIAKFFGFTSWDKLF